MKLTTKRYEVLITAQSTLLLTDFMINTLAYCVGISNALALILFVFQDICIVLSFSAIFLSFFATYVFQVGFIEILFDRFRKTIVLCIVYFLFTLSIQIWTLVDRKDSRWNYNWTTEYTTFFLLQRLLSPMYYYGVKRCFLRISDPRFYGDDIWEAGSIKGTSSAYK